MAEKVQNQKDFTTCLEDTPMAEMMQKMFGQQGIGSLCTEMMKKVTEKKGDCCGFSCAEMMRDMMKGCRGTDERPKETKKEEGHVGDK